MKKRLICKKFFGCLLAGSLIMGSLSGCGSQDTSKETSETKKETSSEQKETSSEQKTTQVEEDAKVTIAWTESSAVTAHSADLSETALGKAWQEATGIDLDIVHVADAQAFNLMFSSGELPDVIFYNVYTYPGGPQAMVADGIIEPLNEYMEYAPNLQAVLDDRENVKDTITTVDGDIIGFPWIRDDSEPGALNVMGISIRQDWLQDLGLEFPKTADELYEVLKAFKEEKGAEYPLSAYSTWHFMSAITDGMLTSPFGLVKGNFYQKDGKVHYGYAEQEYKAVLEWLNKLYEEELLDPNFAAIDSATFDANMTNGVSGVGIISCNTANRLTAAVAETNPEYDLIGMPPLGTADGDIAMSTSKTDVIYGTVAAITTDCENVEAAMKFLDYAYSEEGTMLLNFGIEGESYEIVDGVPKETEIIEKHPDGWSALEARAYYQLNWDSGPMIQLYIPESVPERTRTTRMNFSVANTDEYLMPRLFYDEETTAEIAKICTEMDTLVQEKFIKYVMGTESLDTFDDYVKTLNQIGLDKVLAYQQEALDAYNSK